MLLSRRPPRFCPAFSRGDNYPDTGGLDGTPPPAPKLHAVRPAVDGAPLWPLLATCDPRGEAYLKSRGLTGADVRFVQRGTHEYLDWLITLDCIVAVPLRDRSGAVLDFQTRSVNPALKGQDSKRSLRGERPKGIAFGRPDLAQTASRIYVAEGMADTLALQLAGVVVVGAPGASLIHHLAQLIPDRREVVFCTQNDLNETSAKGFAQLEQKLRTKHCTLFELVTPKAHKDPADWLQDVGLDDFRQAMGAVQLRGASEIQASVTAVVEQLPDLPELTKSYASALAILRADTSVCPGRLGYDQMICQPTVDGRCLRDADVGVIRERIELKYKDCKNRPIRFGADDVRAALEQVADERPYHPLVDYLEGLKWDGVKRIERVAGEVLGAPSTAENIEIVLRWFIGAARRPLIAAKDPNGCKVDTVLILQGDQGARKSTFFSELMPNRSWFSDAKVDIDNKDALMLLRKVWLLEWGELDAMQRARDAEAIKAFITAQVDAFRPPYGRSVIEAPRHTIIAGTTNQRDFLADPTGNRRFWVIHIPGEINVPLLQEWRDQLWAEAVHLHRAGEPHWFDRQEEMTIAATREEWESEDPWTDKVRAWLQDRVKGLTLMVAEPPTTSEILSQAIEKPVAMVTTGDGRRLAAIMRRIGWRQSFDGPAKARRRVWSPPS